MTQSVSDIVDYITWRYWHQGGPDYLNMTCPANQGLPDSVALLYEVNYIKHTAFIMNYMQNIVLETLQLQ
jgi:hypothetical protein